jgi:hypothetical protein
MSVIDTSWLPPASMKRIICHWTAGGYTASDLDKKHYHILIENDGTLVRGRHTISDNESTADGNYAAHTRGINARSIGIAVCCMADASERPFDAGRFPMTEMQWRTMAAVVAELCRAYHIEVTPTTVLGHGEVERSLGVKQRGKWDPMVLPWEPHLSLQEVGHRFRELVRAFLAGEGQDETSGATLDVSVNGTPVGASLLANEAAYLKIASLVNDLHWPLLNASQDFVVFFPDGAHEPLFLHHEFLDDNVVIGDEAQEADIVELLLAQGYVLAQELALSLNLPMVFQASQNLLTIGDQPQADTDMANAAPAPQRVVIKPGDTLSALAARHLGRASRWRDLRKPDGTPFSEREARTIRPGDVVLLPQPQQAQPALLTAVGPLTPAQPDAVAINFATAGIDLEALIDAAGSTVRRLARESIPIIVAECLASGIVDKAHIAYILATSEHESKAGKFMTELWGPTPAQRRYEGRQDLGNTQRGDGFRFRGRGYVQITGRTNYDFWSQRLHIDLIADPDHVARDPSTAAKILVQGMRDGTFRPSHALGRYLTETQRDFFHARAIINADKEIIDRGHTQNRGTRIAALAQHYLEAMTS